MQSDAKSIWLKVPSLPAGRYSGRKTGYVVRVETDADIFEIKTRNGVRGIDIPCFVNVERGMVSVEMCH